MDEKQINAAQMQVIKNLLEQTLLVDGDVAELGCYAGDSSLVFGKILKNTKKALWLYDSFEGLPAKSPEDQSALGIHFCPGELKASKHAVMRKFQHANLPLPHIKKAWFEDLKASDLPELICFALLDGDYYASIKISLNLVTNRMNLGGKIVVHDYSNPALPGARRAVDEFALKHPNYKLEQKSGLAVLTREC